MPNTKSSVATVRLKRPVLKSKLQTFHPSKFFIPDWTCTFLSSVSLCQSITVLLYPTTTLSNGINSEKQHVETCWAMKQYLLVPTTSTKALKQKQHHMYQDSFLHPACPPEKGCLLAAMASDWFLTPSIIVKGWACLVLSTILHSTFSASKIL